MAERISLVEQYDNKDMIVQVKKCLDRTADAVSVSTEARDTAVASAAEAHTASTNANAASTQAQTAAATVATYETRLGAVENESAGNRSSIQTIDGEITDIYNDLTNVVRKVGDPGQIVYNGLELRGTNRTPDTTVGELNDLIVNAKRLINEIDTKLNSYEQMVRTTGDQTIAGLKNLSGGIDIQNQPTVLQVEVPNLENQATTVSTMSKINFVCGDGTIVAYIRFNNRISAGVRGVQLVLFDGSGTASVTNLGTVTI